MLWPFLFLSQFNEIKRVVLSLPSEEKVDFKYTAHKLSEF